MDVSQFCSLHDWLIPVKEESAVSLNESYHSIAILNNALCSFQIANTVVYFCKPPNQLSNSCPYGQISLSAYINTTHKNSSREDMPSKSSNTTNTMQHAIINKLAPSLLLVLDGKNYLVDHTQIENLSIPKDAQKCADDVPSAFINFPGIQMRWWVELNETVTPNAAIKQLTHAISTMNQHLQPILYAQKPYSTGMCPTETEAQFIDSFSTTYTKMTVQDIETYLEYKMRNFVELTSTCDALLAPIVSDHVIRRSLLETVSLNDIIFNDSLQRDHLCKFTAQTKVHGKEGISTAVCSGQQNAETGSTKDKLATPVEGELENSVELSCFSQAVKQYHNSIISKPASAALTSYFEQQLKDNDARLKRCIDDLYGTVSLSQQAPGKVSAVVNSDTNKPSFEHDQTAFNAQGTSSSDKAGAVFSGSTNEQGSKKLVGNIASPTLEMEFTALQHSSDNQLLAMILPNQM